MIDSIWRQKKATSRTQREIDEQDKKDFLKGVVVDHLDGAAGEKAWTQATAAQMKGADSMWGML